MDGVEALGSIRDPQTYAIIGAAMELHGEFGCGFLEHAYQEAMALEMTGRKVPFAQNVEMVIKYKGVPLKCKYVADFVCFGEIIVEIKAIGKLGGIERAQVINYLKASGFKRALLINFGAKRLEFERIVLNY
jgi:GxxExxY protein